MRTTVTLEKDVEKLLRETMHRNRTSFKQTLNAAIRAGLGKNKSRTLRRPFVIRAKPLGLRAGLDPAGFNKLVDDLELEAVLRNQAGGARDHS